MTLKIILLALTTVCITSCWTPTAPKMNRVSVGMSKQEVIAAMGEPVSTASPGGGIEIIRYRLSEDSYQEYYWTGAEYFVKLIRGKVDSYGKVGDFGSTVGPTLNVNLHNN